MSGDSSLGIGIGLALKSYGRAVSYVKIGRVLDLTTPFSELTFTLADKSGEGNDATLYSGRYISTDGSTDRGIVADCSAAGAGNYYLTGKVRPNAVTTAELTMDGSTDSGLTGLTADVWQTFTTATSAVTPSAVQVGYDGSTASAADWSDVKLIDSSDGSTVARWQLNESADGDLNGYPALDSVGGYHGTHTGCAGGTGEGIDADVAGAAFAANEDKMYFDGVDDYVGLDSVVNFGTGNWSVSAKVLYKGNGVVVGSDIYWTMRLATSTVISCRSSTGGTIYNITLDSALILGNLYELTISRNGTTISVQVDGATQASTLTCLVGDTFIVDEFGSRTNGSIDLIAGVIYDISLVDDGVEIHSYQGYGNTNADWLDQVGSNNGTVNGSPVTVGQKRATILQTAGMDWNKRMWFDGVDDSVVSAAPVFPATADFDETFYLYVGRSNNPDNYDYAVAQYTNIDNTFGVALQPSDSKLVLVVSGLLSIESLQSYNSEFLTVRLVRTSGTISFYINEILQGTDSSGVSIPQGNTVFGDNAPQIGNRHWLGLIYGNSVDGTVNGSPSNFLVPASDATPTNDALGNAIANPRPTTDTWNFFGDGEYGRVADADSLDLTTEATWEMWGNFYGVPSASQTLFSKYTDGANREWWIQKSTINAADEVRFLAFGNGTSLVQAVSGITDQVGHLVFTLDQTNGLKAYWNGVAMTVPAHAPILLDFATKTSPVVIGALASLSNFSDEKISRPKIYNRAFTADEVLKNYNAQKGAFGL